MKNLHKWHPPLTVPRHFWSSGYYNAFQISVEEVQKINTDESLEMRKRLEASELDLPNLARVSSQAVCG